MRNLLSGIVTGACLVVLWAVLTKPSVKADHWGLGPVYNLVEGTREAWNG